MLSIDEINKAILDLEQHDTTYSVCEKLSWLYIVRDHLTGQQQKQPVPLDISGDSEFLQAVKGKNSVSVWNVMDDLMDTLKAVNPKAYNGVMRKIMEL